MKNKSIRNPFPMLWKVFLHEMENSWRILVPVYGVLLFIALLTGLLVFDGYDSVAEVWDGSALSSVRTTLIVLMGMLYVASFVVTISFLNKRFRSSMLGDEAYLDLSLPVTMGEHVWGRVLCALVWSFAYVVAVALSLVLLLVHAWSGDPVNFFSEIVAKPLSEYGVSKFFAVFFEMVTSFLLLVMFVFIVNAVGHLAKKHRTLVEVAFVIVLLTVMARIGFSDGSVVSFDWDTSASVWIGVLVNAVWIAVFGVATQLILTFRLNLE